MMPRDCANSFASALLALVLLGAGSPRGYPQERAVAPYSYYHDGKLVVLTPSSSLIAVSEAGREFGAFIASQRLTRDPRSAHPALRARRLGLYALPASLHKADLQHDLLTQARAFTARTHEEVQPVFEQGGALLLPSDELIVKLSRADTVAEAEKLLESQKAALRIVEVRLLRDGTFLLRIKDAAQGGVYEACRGLAKLDGVVFAEPNHTVVILGPPMAPEGVRNYVEELARARQGQAGRSADAARAGQPRVASHSVAWDVLIDESFESGGLPAGWSTGRLPPPPSAPPGTLRPDVAWNVTTLRGHDGNASAYATGAGTAGRPAPWPYPNDAGTWLSTPVLDLSSYQEVYVEMWIWARFGANANVPYDLAAVWVRDTAAGQIQLVSPSSAIFVGYTGDLTADPTADHGWRRALFRLPPAARRSAAAVEIAFAADSADADEGLYVDSVRVVATKNVDVEPVGDDRFAGRQYEIANAGQIAGLGSHANGLRAVEAWQRVSPSSQLVVAVVDTGVESHADLNLVTGYDYDGSVGGGPRLPHGTSVAGNVGAIGDNTIGVVGTAPGVKIMPVYMGETYERIAAALRLAVSKGADVVTNSWGWVDAASSEIEDAVRDALAAGVPVLFAAGNGPDRPPFTYRTVFPCNLTSTSDVVCVGASSPTDEYKGAGSSDGVFWWGSSYVGAGPDVVAPGPWSYTTDQAGALGYNDGSEIDPSDPATAGYTGGFGGTSSSTPKVAGIVALMLSANPGLSSAQVKALLRDTAVDIDAPGFDDKTGAGRVDAPRAVDGALATAGQLRGYDVQAVGAPGLARTGNRQSAAIVAAINSPEGPVTGLQAGDFRVSLATRPPLACPVEITRVASGFPGRYRLDLVPSSWVPACAWRAGRYTFGILANRGRRSGVGVVDLDIP